MELIVPAENPSILRLVDFDDPHSTIKESLTYTDKAANFLFQKFKKSTYLVHQMGIERYEEKLAEMKASVKKTLLFQDEQGWYTYSGLKTYLSVKTGLAVQNKVVYPKAKKVAWLNVPEYEPYPYQTLSHDRLLEAKHGGVEIGCHAKGQKVLKSDGQLVAVEDVAVGDCLLGPDSLPRRVLELRTGKDSMFRLETSNGHVMLINGNHLLALKRTNRSKNTSVKPRKDYKGRNPTVIMTVNDYLGQTAKFKHLYKTYSPEMVNFPESEVPVQPYLLGALLGDGSILSTPKITTADAEMVKYIYDAAKVWGLDVTESASKSAATDYSLVRVNGTDLENPLTHQLRQLGVWGLTSGFKFVPQNYKTNSVEVRKQILAGLLDTDGSLTGGCFDYISKSKQLTDDVCFLARSLGLRATGPTECQKKDQNGTEGTYFRACLSGRLDIVPTLIARKQAKARKQIKSPNMFGFTLTKMSDSEDYYGFVLDQDHLYLTDTFLVTHNTGLGKSYIITLLCRSIGLKTIVMTPSTNISEQLYESFVKAFGKKLVGKFFDGKKESNKLFVIANAQSLTKVTEGTPHWEALSSSQVFIADESHQCPASTMASVCMGVAKTAPYRYFFSATQMRNDGRDRLLEGITGDIVYEKTVYEGVKEGYLAKPIFRLVGIPAEDNYESSDVNEMTRHHLYYNDKVAKFIGQACNASVQAGMPVVVLIEEVEQFSKLLPYLRHEVAFAHGPLTENKAKVPKEYWESDPSELVRTFNDGKVPILVGTSCISTGTDIKAVKTLIYWQGGKSEIQVKQAIGRSTRKPPGKTFCTIMDFDIYNVSTLNRHFLARKAIYRELYPDVKDQIYPYGAP